MWWCHNLGILSCVTEWNCAKFTCHMSPTWCIKRHWCLNWRMCWPDFLLPLFLHVTDLRVALNLSGISWDSLFLWHSFNLHPLCQSTLILCGSWTGQNIQCVNFLLPSGKRTVGLCLFYTSWRSIHNVRDRPWSPSWSSPSRESPDLSFFWRCWLECIHCLHCRNQGCFMIVCSFPSVLSDYTEADWPRRLITRVFNWSHFYSPWGRIAMLCIMHHIPHSK